MDFVKQQYASHRSLVFMAVLVLVALSVISAVFSAARKVVLVGIALFIVLVLFKFLTPAFKVGAVHITKF